MEPSHEEIRDFVLELPENFKLRETDDSFDYCRAVCRTNSKAVHGTNQYKNSEKYCFGIEGPPLVNETVVLESNKVNETMDEEQEMGTIPSDNPNEEVASAFRFGSTHRSSGTTSTPGFMLLLLILFCFL